MSMQFVSQFSCAHLFSIKLQHNLVSFTTVIQVSHSPFGCHNVPSYKCCYHIFKKEYHNRYDNLVRFQYRQAFSLI